MSSVGTVGNTSNVISTPKYVVTDTETGGLEPRLHPLLAVSILICDENYAEHDEGWEQRVLPPPKTVLEIPYLEFQYKDDKWKNPVGRTLQGYLDVQTKKLMGVEEFKELLAADASLPAATFEERFAGIAEGKRYPLVITAYAAELTGYVTHKPGTRGEVWDLEAIDKWHQGALPLDMADKMYVKYLAQAFRFKPVAVAHNASFDSKFIQYYLPNAFTQLTRFLCTMKMFQVWRKEHNERGSASLNALVERAGIKVAGKRHGSLADSQACLQGLRWLAQENMKVEADYNA